MKITESSMKGMIKDNIRKLERRKKTGEKKGKLDFFHLVKNPVDFLCSRGKQELSEDNTARRKGLIG